MRWLARARQLNARRPWIRWSIVAGVALMVASTMMAWTGDLRDRREAWGALRPVLVARRDLPPGGAVTVDDVFVEERPAALVPAAALQDPGALTSATRSWQWVAAGETLTFHDLTATSSPAARLPAGTRGIMVGANGLPVVSGDGVELVIDGQQVIPATVIEVISGRSDALGASGSRGLLVAVAATVAPPVAAAVADGRVTVLLGSAIVQRQPAANTTTISAANATR